MHMLLLCPWVEPVWFGVRLAFGLMGMEFLPLEFGLEG